MNHDRKESYLYYILSVAPKEEIRQRQFSSKNGHSFNDEGDALVSGQTRKYFPETWLFYEEDVGYDVLLWHFVTLPWQIE